ncbi:hypothetical protein VTO42DRAFT_5109 [Malbranchea cinnamomea]
MASNYEEDTADEYEYEYDENETETFYLNVDLSSCHGPIKPPRKRSVAPTVLGAEPDHIPQAMLEVDPNLRVDPGLVPQDRIQIMELHTDNPVVSYQNQIFTCSWVDLLGSELIFSFPGELPDIPKLRAEKDFDLISASQVKLMGQRANIISASGKDKSWMRHAPPQHPALDLGLPPTNQGKFLQRLMEVKRRKGETDMVRTAFPTKRIYYSLDLHSHGGSEIDAQTDEIDEVHQSLADDGGRLSHTRNSSSEASDRPEQAFNHRES